MPRPLDPMLPAAATRHGMAMPGPAWTAAAVLFVLAVPAAAQGFLSPGASGLSPPGQLGGPPGSTPVPRTAAPAAAQRALPSLRLPAVPGVPGAAQPNADADLAASPTARSALPASRPVPLPPALPPAEAAARLRRMVEGAWARSPELAGIPGRQTAALARGQSADSVTPGPPQLGGGFVTDGISNARGGREIELSLATPLWLPGEGRASRSVADADFSRLTAQQQAQALVVAGEVREALAAVALARVELSGAEARLRDARSLEADVGRRVRARDAAEAELLTARLDRLEVEVALRERQATLEGARLAFETLTGQEPEPAALNEPASPPTAGVLGDGHPRLREAEAARAVAEANRRLASIQVRESPEIGLLGRRTREAGSDRYDNRVGLQFRLPLSTEARNAPRRATAEAEMTEASAAVANVRRQIELQVARARVELAAAEAGREAARTRAGVLRQQRGLSEAAFRAGQFGLADTIRVRALTTEAEVSQGRAEIAVRQARGRVNQAMGVLP